MSLLIAGGWARWPLKVPCNPKHSMILFYSMISCAFLQMHGRKVNKWGNVVKKEAFRSLFNCLMSVSMHRFHVSAPAEKWETLLLSRSAFSSGSGRASAWGLRVFKVGFRAKHLAELTQKSSSMTGRTAGKGPGFVLMSWSLKCIQFRGHQRDGGEP